MAVSDMQQDPAILTALLGTAVTIAFVHTAIGVDHTLPFIALARARRWSLTRLWAVVLVCGLGHVGSSIVLGGVGLGLDVALERMEWVEGARGRWASWLLIVFGLVLLVRGLLRRSRAHTHSHVHVHGDGVVHSHHHNHLGEHHRHPHGGLEAQQAGRFGVWGLFIIFVFGPCEPLIPLLMAPAAMHHWSWVLAVVLAFAGVTIAVMLAIVTAAHLGLRRLPLGSLERHADVMSGGAIALSGLAVRVLGI